MAEYDQFAAGYGVRFAPLFSLRGTAASGSGFYTQACDRAGPLPWPQVSSPCCPLAGERWAFAGPLFLRVRGHGA